MIEISESFITPHDHADVFEFVSDFGFISSWDPNVASSMRRAPSSPLAVGALADLEVRFGGRTLQINQFAKLDLAVGGRRPVEAGVKSHSVGGAFGSQRAVEDDSGCVATDLFLRPVRTD